VTGADVACTAERWSDRNSVDCRNIGDGRDDRYPDRYVSGSRFSARASVGPKFRPGIWTYIRLREKAIGLRLAQDAKSTSELPSSNGIPPIGWAKTEPNTFPFCAGWPSPWHPSLATVQLKETCLPKKWVEAAK
jgi:hypothetical protein